ncbi:MAG: hypothetical protein JXJ04_17855 [Spirochaetales bacterium]|nr:hypothetical protein [Spirochaetales bacterium]
MAGELKKATQFQSAQGENTFLTVFTGMVVTETIGHTDDPENFINVMNC